MVPRRVEPFLAQEHFFALAHCWQFTGLCRGRYSYMIQRNPSLRASILRCECSSVWIVGYEWCTRDCWDWRNGSEGRIFCLCLLNENEMWFCGVFTNTFFVLVCVGRYRYIWKGILQRYLNLITCIVLNPKELAICWLPCTHILHIYP